MEKIKEFFKKCEYCKKGLIIGGIIGFFLTILQFVTMMAGIDIIYRINFISVYFTELIIHLIDTYGSYGEAYIVYMSFIFIIINILYYLIIGYVIGLIYSIIKHEYSIIKHEKKK